MPSGLYRSSERFASDQHREMPFGPSGKEASSGAETLRGDGLQIVKGEGNNLGAEWIGFRLGLFFGGDEISVGIELQATR